MINELPDPFVFLSGERIKNPAEWPQRRQEILKVLLDIEYGHLPPKALTKGEHLYTHELPDLLNARDTQVRLVTGPSRLFMFYLQIIAPQGEGPFPVVLTGDACWRYVTDDVIREVIGRGYILAQFNRVTLAPDDYKLERSQGLYQVYPEGDFGALAAWAWGYHRCVDYLLTLPEVAADKIAVVGHSRGGKTVLLAGATDERIALTAPNNSGCGGAGCMRWQGPASETIGDIMRLAGNWFSPRLNEYVGHEERLPFDQHFLKALVAPRALLSTEALGDLWANPSGTWLTHQAAKEVYRFLGCEEKIAAWYRQGGHNQGLVDWQTFLDYADWQFFGKQPQVEFNLNPFPELARNFSWQAPMV
jgi:hypothetical protein